MSNLEMRGLTMFISDIRNCRTKDVEMKRINKELAKIRQKFKENTKMTGYDRKKYIAKLLYIFMLGYNVDFGHIEAVTLLSSDKYSEKHLGYLACTLLLDETHELLTLIINSVAQDLLSHNENFQCLALTAIANVGGKQFAEALCAEVIKVLTDKDTKTVVIKKAALTLLRLYRKYPDVFPPDEWSGKVIALLDRPDLGVLTSAASLLVGLASDNPSTYENAIPKAVKVLVKIVLQKDYSADYVYYGVPTPWLQVKLLRLLQYFPFPADANLGNRITEVLQRILGGSEIVPKAPNKTNAIHAVLYEAISLVLVYNSNPELLNQAVTILSRYLVVKDANLKYLALECLTRVSSSEALKKQQEVVIQSLKDADISIRRRSLEVLYCMCDSSNADSIIKELLEYLATSDFSIREDLVLRTALLAERFSASPREYLDTIVSLLSVAGDFVLEDVWHRCIQVITNTQDDSLKAYAADTLYNRIRTPGAHENMVRLASYVLGEYTRTSSTIRASDSFEALQRAFPAISGKAQQMVLTAYVKLANSDSSLRDRVKKVFAGLEKSMDIEVQQRAIEFRSLLESEWASTVLEEMPAFPERESSVMRLLRAKQTDTTDKSAFKKDERAEGEVAEGEGEVEEERPRSGPAMGHGAAKAKEADLLSLDDALTSAPAPASSGRAAPVTSSSLLDDILSAPAPAAAPAPVHHAPAAAAPVSADDFFGPAPTSSAGGMMGMGSNVVDLNTVLGDAINNCYRALVLSDRGVLFENDHMQIGCVTEISGPQARVTLFLGNKANAPLTSLSATLDNSSFNPTELRCAAAAIPPMVAPRQQVQIIIQAQLAGFYDQVPRFTLSYMADGKEHRGVFNVPLPVTKFSVPIPIQGADAFFGRWRSIVGDGTEQQEVFKANPQRGVDVAYAQRVLSQGLRMNVVQGVDPNPANVVSAGGIQTGTGQQCVILVRIESNAQSQAYRLTVRAQDARVARQLLQLVKTQL